MHSQQWTLNGLPFELHHASIAASHPQVTVEWPPDGYTFKKMGNGPTAFTPFMRVRAEPRGNYQLGISVDGGLPQVCATIQLMLAVIDHACTSLSGMHAYLCERSLSVFVNEACLSL